VSAQTQNTLYSALQQGLVKMLDISTCHIPKRTADALGEPNSPVKPALWDVLSYVHYHEYGWIIFADRGDNPSLMEEHPELARLLTLASELGADHLKLDCDATQIKELPQFEW
jgi:hypothetical protein